MAVLQNFKPCFLSVHRVLYCKFVTAMQFMNPQSIFFCWWQETFTTTMSDLALSEQKKGSITSSSKVSSVTVSLNVGGNFVSSTVVSITAFLKVGNITASSKVGGINDSVKIKVY